MPKTTANYGFKKPLYTENADVKIINDNFEMIDVLLTPTVSASTAPGSNSTGKLSNVLGWLANRIKAITGLTSWQDTPSVTLKDCYDHIQHGYHDTATPITSGFMSHTDKLYLDNATPEKNPDTFVKRDENGRIKVEVPSETYDAANKGYVDTNCVRKDVNCQMNAILTAQSNTAFTSRQVRNIVLWTSGSTPPSTAYGDIVIKTF